MSCVNDPKHWRDRADAMRALANTFSDLKARESMRDVAEAYDRMAERAQSARLVQEPTTEGT